MQHLKEGGADVAGSSKMKVIIAGSRDITDYSLLERVVDRALIEWCADKTSIDFVVCGCAHGVDRLGEQWAKSNGVRVIRMPADWVTYGKVAGYVRNAEMAHYGTHLVAIWDGASKGTQNMIETMGKLDKPVFVHQIMSAAQP